MTNPLEEAADDLTRTVQALNQTVRRATEIRDELSDVIKQSRQTRRLVTYVLIGLALDVILTVGMILVGVNTASNTDRINTVQQVQHDGALCPLYKVLISGDTPANRDRAASQGQDMPERARQYAIIRQSYKALKCEAK